MSKISLKGIEARLKHLKSTIACGFHSGIPACCIKFYITKWLWIEKATTDKNDYFNKYWRKMNEKRKIILNPITNKIEYSFTYIPCPTCLKYERFVKIKSCPKNSKCYHKDEWSK